MASDDTPRRGESASGTGFKRERQLRALLEGQIDLLRDRVSVASRAESIEEQRELLEEARDEAALLVDVIEAMEGRTE
mgnify:CR=1 FL=1